MLAGLYSFTCPHMSGTQLVQSMFTTQLSYRAFLSPSDRSWWLQTDMPLQQWGFIFRHFVNHPEGLPCWLKFELAQFICFFSPCPCLFVLSPRKLQSFGSKQVIVWGWTVSVFTVPAPLCAFHSNCLHCQDVTKQISLETKEKMFLEKERTMTASISSPRIFSVFQTYRSEIELKSPCRIMHSQVIS